MSDRLAPPGAVITLPSAATTAIEGAVLGWDTNGNVKMPAAALEKPAGVAWEDSEVRSSAAVDSIAVQTFGVASCISDGSAAITAGDQVAIADTSGRVKTVTTTFGANAIAWQVGTALETVANGATNARVLVLLGVHPYQVT